MTSPHELAKELEVGERILRAHPSEWYRGADHLAAARSLIERPYSGVGVTLETTLEVKVELSRRLAKARPGPWHSDCERSDGIYGSGEDTHEGFNSFYVLDAENRRVVDTLNSDATVEVEYDEDGTHAWDEAGRQSVELIVLLRNECGHLLADIDTLLALLAAERERAGRMEKALRPFASVADLYDDREDDSFQLHRDAHEVKITLGQCRAARAILTGEQTNG